ncbi:nuclear valosin-containing protein-like isoform X2 [Ambystoma mexicanum]|uniref:nuclear valosin-containing protein-like isoform X2 n=1 Tax=Ambystoma mexicanum TaxID=8296 RepID=UPI0037E71A12
MAPFIDNRLKQRVKQYLSSNRCGSYVDIGIMSADLQQTYSVDYGRRKRNAFKIQVEKVFQVISREKERLDSSLLEDEHLSKRARQGGESAGALDSYTEDSSDVEECQVYPSSNLMNSSLLSLYRKGNPDSAPDTPTREETANTSTPVQATTAKAEKLIPPSTRTSGGGWFIDKTPTRNGEQSILIDLSEEYKEEPSKATSLNSVDYSLLEGESRKTKLKKGKRRKADAENVDGEIESYLLNRKAKSKVPQLQHSSVKFEDVGGIEDTLKEVCKMLIHMRHPEIYQHLGVVPPRGFLLHGPPGCGKTLLAQAISGELDLPILKVAATEMVSGVSGESEQKLRELFDQAVSSAPCILFIDEIDAITPKREVASKDMERRIVAQLLTCMDDMNSLAVTAQVLVIGATNRPDSLDPALRRAGRFDREICLGIPDEAARERILKTLCRKLKLPESFDFHHLAHMTPGYVGADLMALCREAAMCAVNRVLIDLDGVQTNVAPAADGSEVVEQNGMEETGHAVKEACPATLLVKDELQKLLELLKQQIPLDEQQLQKLCIEMNDFIVALASVQPSAKREGFATVPDVTWADIGALEEIREELTMAILAVANESGLNFISVKGPELLNMYVGESERAVRQVFQRASNSSPCVIFFDEIDALCPRRSGHESGSSIRVVNQLLTEMDGLERRRQVFIMAATNRPDIIDPAILRPGRLDKTLYVGLPPPMDRYAILKTITKEGTQPPLEADVSLEEIAHDLRSDCYTGADLSALVREASVTALRQEMARQSLKNAGLSGGIKIGRQHFEEAFRKVKPSVSKKDQAMYEQLRQSLN